MLIELEVGSIEEATQKSDAVALPSSTSCISFSITAACAVNLPGLSRPQYSALGRGEGVTSVACATFATSSPAPRVGPPGCNASATKATTSAVLITASPV